MERREKILLVGLVFAAGLAAYYYSDSFMGYLGFGGGREGENSKPAMKSVQNKTAGNDEDSSSSRETEESNTATGQESDSIEDRQQQSDRPKTNKQENTQSTVKSSQEGKESPERNNLSPTESDTEEQKIQKVSDKTKGTKESVSDPRVNRVDARAPPQRVSTDAPAESGESIRSGPGGFPVANPPRNFVKARRLFENGFYDRSLKKLRALYEKYPRSSNVNYLLGLNLRKTGANREAQKHFKRCARLDHDPQLQYWCQHELES